MLRLLPDTTAGQISTGQKLVKDCRAAFQRVFTESGWSQVTRAPGRLEESPGPHFARALDSSPDAYPPVETL